MKKGKLFSEAGKSHYALLTRNFGRNPNELKTSDIEANAALAKIVVENFDEVQQIWDEIDHYKKHRKAKGEHPVFKAAEAQKKVSELTDVELLKIVRNRPADILKYAKQRIPAAKTKQQQQDLLAKVEAWKVELEQARSEAKRRGVLK